MRAAPVAVATAVAVVAAVGVGVAVASSGDDARTVDAVGVGAVTVDDGSTDDASSSPTGSPSATPTSSATPQQVDGLEQLQGVLVRDSDDDGSDDDGLDDDGSDDSSDDRADFEVAGVDLDLGPDGWLVSGGAVADYDGDGAVRPVVEELEALLGQEVTVAGRYDTGSDDGDDGRSDDSGRDDRDDRDDDLDVYEIQGLAFRDTTGGPAPWATAGATSTSGATGAATATATTTTDDDTRDDDRDDRDDRDDDGAALPAGSPERAELERIATDAVGADSRVTSFDREDDGGAAWEVEVLDAQGVEQRVLLDAAGTVLDIRPED